MRSNMKIVLAAVLLALIANLAMAAKHTTTTTTTHHKKATTTTKATKKATTTTKHTTTTTKATTTTTAKPTATPKMGQTAVILSATDYCIFLPPKYGGDIAANEDRAVAFCTKPNLPGAPNAQVLPAGFIKSSHYVVNTQKGYVQITGRIDRSKYGLSSKDGGGQYDLRAPVGSKMNGYNAFVQLTEPDAQIFCIRACTTKADCPVNKSTYGCEKVLGGDYS
ncbi:MAG: hypothetical protein JOS17DRAFT_733344 [Linnemannia elongata]|nr:MAG: hypothetical protein JOS17DRAFT_733344 [Linnemannia elongata]